MRSAETHESLLKRIRERRHTLKSFIYRFDPIGNRLTAINIICGALATFLIATPALGGKSLMDAFGIIDHNSLIWKIPFGAAIVFSLFSTLANSLYAYLNIASHLSQARVCDTKLEKIQMLLEQHDIKLKEAAIEYTQCIAEIYFIIGFFKLPSSPDWVKGQINEPSPNQGVESTISCSGWVEGVGPECHLWLAVEAGGNIWYKEGEFFAEDDGSWQKSIYEDGKTEAFFISLYAANNHANKRIRAWLDEGDKTGNYNSMRRERGARRIARIDGLHRAIGNKVEGRRAA
jgi:hypothetical protein